MSAKRTLEQIEQEIKETKEALKDIHGTETEVYARIVGYYRAVKNWNKGKRDEFNLRKMFTLEDSKKYSMPAEKSMENAEKTVTDETKSEKQPVMNTEAVAYEIYTKKTCPNCPPVKEFMSQIELPGIAVDVDTKEGLTQAAKKGVFASPTVIFYNAQGIETARCHNVEELETVFNKVSVTA